MKRNGKLFSGLACVERVVCASCLQTAILAMTSKETKSDSSVAAVDGPGVLMIGTGEYTTGYVNGQQTLSDKSSGVVALTMFDLRERGKGRTLHPLA